MMSLSKKRGLVGLEAQEKTREYTFALYFSLSNSSYSLWKQFEPIQSGSFSPISDYKDEQVLETLKWFINAIEVVGIDRLNIVIREPTLKTRFTGSNRHFNNTSNSVVAFRTLSQMQGAIIYALTKLGLEYQVYTAGEWNAIHELRNTTIRGKERELLEIAERDFGIFLEEQEVNSFGLGYAYIKEALASR